MNDIFRVEMLPAREGDCIVIAYGEAHRPCRVMVDGGRLATYSVVRERFSHLPDTERTFELLIVSHVDRDHIEGILAMLEDPDPPVQFKDVWFNGYDHLRDPDVEAFGAVQGERLTAALQRHLDRWNAAFGRRSVEMRSGQNQITLDGGLEITLLSPDRKKLESMIPVWKRECEKAGLIPGLAAQLPTLPDDLERLGSIDINQLAGQTFVPDRAEANGTSIAILARYQERRVLLTADSHADLLLDSLRPLAIAHGGTLRLDALKIPHHGSQHNLSTELLELVSCPRFLISTNGDYFGHPDAVAVARVIKHGGDRPELIFNYSSDETLLWNNSRWKSQFGYTTTYPVPSQNGTQVVDLS